MLSSSRTTERLEMHEPLRRTHHKLIAAPPPEHDDVMGSDGKPEGMKMETRAASDEMPTLGASSSSHSSSA